MLEVLEGMHWRNFSQRLRLKCNILHQCPLGSCSCPRWLNTPRLPQRAPGTKSTSIIINVHHIVKSTSLIICPDLIWSYLPTCSIHETLAPFSSAHKFACQTMSSSTIFNQFSMIQKRMIGTGDWQYQDWQVSMILLLVEMMVDLSTFRSSVVTHVTAKQESLIHPMYSLYFPYST